MPNSAKSEKGGGKKPVANQPAEPTRSTTSVMLDRQIAKMLQVVGQHENKSADDLVKECQPFKAWLRARYLEALKEMSEKVDEGEV